MRKSIFFAFALAAIFAGCSETQNETAALQTSTQSITKGTPDTAPEHNGVVLIAVNNEGFCTGTLIHKNYVLTAAHCLADLTSAEKKSLVIGIGNSESAALNHTYKVSKSWYHENYDPDLIQNDIALLKLAKSVPASEAQPIAPLPPQLAVSNAELDSKGVDVVYAGYGYDENWNYGKKNRIELPLLGYCGAFNTPASSNLGCSVNLKSGWFSSIFSNRITIPFGTMVASLSDGGVCNGDSGGPAFVKRDGVEYVFGVTSYGDTNCAVYGVSTSVPDFYDWILEKAPELGYVPEICDDGIDNDGDSFVDCKDQDCREDPACYAPEICDDGIDNDNDGYIDCKDYDCSDDVACIVYPEVCDDGLDNDRDGKIDCDDKDCTTNAACIIPVEICDDGLDNDRDGKIDCDDDDCANERDCRLKLEIGSECLPETYTARCEGNILLDCSHNIVTAMDCGELTCAIHWNHKIGACTRPCTISDDELYLCEDLNPNDGHVDLTYYTCEYTTEFTHAYFFNDSLECDNICDADAFVCE